MEQTDELTTEQRRILLVLRAHDEERLRDDADRLFDAAGVYASLPEDAQRRTTIEAVTGDLDELQEVGLVASRSDVHPGGLTTYTLSDEGWARTGDPGDLEGDA